MNPFGMPKYPRSVEESEHWIQEAKAREDAVDSIKGFLLILFVLANLAFVVWSIARLFV